MTTSSGEDSRSDSELIAAINDGSTEAFEALYYRYCEWVYRLALRFTADHDCALDVLQETFMYLLRKLPDLVLSAELKTFLYPAVKHTAIALRRKADRVATGDDLIADIAASGEGDDISARDQLAAVLQILPVEQRELLLMRFVDDMTLREIAASLGIPLGTVKSRLHNALRTLREDPRSRRYFQQPTE